MVLVGVTMDVGYFFCWNIQFFCFFSGDPKGITHGKNPHPKYHSHPSRNDPMRRLEMKAFQTSTS